MDKRALFLSLCLFLCAALAGAQDSAGEVAAPAAGGLSPGMVLQRDLETSSLLELADWCRSLGLSEAGGREELSARLRTYYAGQGIVSGSGPGTGAPGAAAGDGEAAAGTGSKNLTITIESAAVTEYFTVEAVHEDYVRLRGNVSVSLKDGETVHQIRAGEILYNRTRNIMSAQGSVSYTKTEGDTVETFRGESITVNMDTWSIVFMEGSSERSLTEGEARYRFAGEVISRSEGDSTVLKNARITNADNEEAYWSIDASKLWLLPGSDWAVFNAVLKVGEIPVLYLPYFYYPADEIIFHPVIGYRSREGSFVQTTTYILGRPKAAANTESSISSIMGSGAGMEKKREGVFLRSLGRKVRDETEPRLSLMADAYANLGFYTGTELSMPAKGSLGELQFSAGLGFSRDIVPTPSGYSPFAPGYDGTSSWNHARLFSAEVPFRYRFTGSGSLSGSGDALSQASLSWHIPFYSDPYVDRDFLHRSEDSDLFTMLQDATTPDMTVYDDTLGSYEWKLSGSLNFKISSWAPYVTTLSLNSAASSVAFNTKTNSSMPSYSPDRTFFYPQKFTLYSLSGTIAGTPLTLGKEKQIQREASPGLFTGILSPVSPWELPGEENPMAEKGPFDLSPPQAVRPLAGTREAAGNNLVMDYRLNPSAASELLFNSTPWTRPQAIDWSDTASMLFTFRMDGNLGLTLSEDRGIYSTSLRFYGVSSWQDYTYMNENAEQYDTAPEREAAMRQVHNMTYFTSSAEYGFTVRPFYQSDVWSASSFQYTLRGMMFKSNYDDSSESWKWRHGYFNREDIEIHRVQANMNALILDKTQNLTITADIPPEESTLGADATIRAWISETNARTRVREPFADPVYEPVYMTETFRFTDRVSLRQYMVYTPEVSDFTVMTTSLSLWDFTASFTATRSKGYYLVDTPGLSTPTGWYENTGGETLNPQELRMSYVKSITTDQTRRFALGLNVNTGLAFDLQRYTYSKYTFSLGFTAKITNFMDIALTSHSENAEVWRYFQDMPFADTSIDLPGEKNVFLDLFNSFRFDDENLRRSSGFKLKSFKFDVVHHLGDWDATLGMTFTPELDNSFPPQYKFNTVISFVIAWKPVKEFKTEMNYDNNKGFTYK